MNRQEKRRAKRELSKKSEGQKIREIDKKGTIEGQAIKTIEEMNRPEEAILKLKLLED